jgi:hypothetical protein
VGYGIVQGHGLPDVQHLGPAFLGDALKLFIQLEMFDGWRWTSTRLAAFERLTPLPEASTLVGRTGVHRSASGLGWRRRALVTQGMT